MTSFVDSNVMLYAVSRHDAEREKRAIARALIGKGDLAISIQVMNEFVWQATRPNRGPGLSMQKALEFTDTWREFAVQDINAAIFQGGRALVIRLNYSWWDCLIIAAAQAQGCDILYSEDMQNGRIIDGMRIVNPFA